MTSVMIAKFSVRHLDYNHEFVYIEKSKLLI